MMERALEWGSRDRGFCQLDVKNWHGRQVLCERVTIHPSIRSLKESEC